MNPVAEQLSRTRPAYNLAALALLVLPWIWPFAGGPSPAVMPWLVSAACAACALVIGVWRPADPVRLAAAAWLVAATVSSVLGLLQYFDLARGLQPWVNVSAGREVFGNLRQRNQFASLVNLGLVALLWGPLAPSLQGRLQAHRPTGAGPPVWHGAARAALVALLATANAATASRTGLLQLFALAPLALFWRPPPGRSAGRLLVLAVGSYAAASVLLPVAAGLDPWVSGISARFLDRQDACQSRLLLWSNVLHLIALKPWFGWGWGELDFAHFITLYPGGRFCDILDNAHNLPLHLAVELGLPASILASGLALWLVARARPWRERDGARRMAWAVLAVIGLHSMLEYPLWYGPFQIAVVLALGILWRIPFQDRPGQADAMPMPLPAQAASTPPSAIRWPVTVAAVLSLAALAYAAWDYRRVSQIYLAPELRAQAYRDDTLRKIQATRLFRNQARFAQLTTSELGPDNAADLNAMAHDLLHFSPEARVAQKLIASADLLGRADEAAFYRLRLRLAFPAEYDRWAGAGAPRSDPASAP